MISESELKYFEKFYIMATKALSMTDPTIDDLKELENKFREVSMVIQAEFFDDAHKMMGDYIMKLQIKRSEDIMLFTMMR